MFRLDKVLRWKERLEKEARAERFDLEGRAEELSTAIRDLVGRRAALPDGGEAAEIREWSRWAEGVRHREALAGRRLEALRPKLQEAARRHVAIRQEVEGLRRLKERAREMERRRRERKDQEASDDTANRRRLPGGGTKFPRPDAATAPARGDHRPEIRAEGGQGPNPRMGA